MENKPTYSGIDQFRVIAALLIVAVHTSPLLSCGEFPDYVLTRVIARLGVPFFFAATGFFLLAPYAEDKRQGAQPIIGFVKKTALIYGGAIVLYLPVSIYSGYVTSESSLLEIGQLLLVEGTLYHLWYLPAAILGVLVVWVFLRYTSLAKATIISCLLYIVGVLGDSYYGITTSLPMLSAAYEDIFAVFSYTRNGLFMAPIFLLVGVWAARLPKMKRSTAFVSWLVTFVLLLVEGILLYGVQGKQHDSMYLMLPLCVLFLMRWLIAFKDPSSKMLRTISLVIYLIHPYMIIAVRGFAKISDLAFIMIDNSMVHYLAVCAGSLLVALLYLWLKKAMGKKV